MLVNVKSYINKPEVAELLSYAVFPDDKSLKAAIQLYEETESLQLYSYEDEKLLVGLIGYEINEERVLTVHHLAVMPENRLKGYGRGIFFELINVQKPSQIIVETDEEAVEFYRNIGFVVYSLGEVHPGVERFRCIYEVEDEEE
ncbi:GNAT family N-acetyltransferase [Paenibacillus crassostreae]|uniref:GNAT family acetyltransferase n=1 Tax=Paenibacillus crassostreae TaxID=1763538 RepID=A0A167FQV1_9BACL|nr:GNAT family N-acetyltransferase [Paenibacillus crassostreae]AOZ94155.1 GNAT family N-acetyltransferase [Paenibacillus crassostreae]OAB76808.1 GNAT family acetyltransferase [Paenibacillus crassostreae]